jgi:putative peptidoglycan lipid II flippase
VSGGILEIRGIADRAVASLLGPGSVSALRYATVLIQPLTQIGPAWASVIYPRLVQSTLGAPGGSLATWADRMLRYAIVIFTPIAALTAAVAPLAVFVAYGRGAFTASDMSLTAGVLAAYAPIIVTLMMLPVLVGSHNARRRGRLMLMGGTVNVILNVVLDLALGFWLGAPGIALGTSIAEIVVVAIFVRALAHSADAFDLGPLVRTIALAFVAVAPAGIAVAVLAWSGFGARDTITGALVLAGFGVVGVLGYVAVASWLDLAPAREVIKYVRERLRGILPSVRRSGRRSD